MSQLLQDLTAELQKLAGTSSQSLRLATTDPRDASQTLELSIQLSEVERLSCAVAEIGLKVPSLAQADAMLLKSWADELCRRVTYLMENLGPIEFEPDAGNVLVRSVTPTQTTTQRAYYEVMLQSQSADVFTLKRFQFTPGTPGRTAVDLQLTHEVLSRLVGDLIESIPV